MRRKLGSFLLVGVLLLGVMLTGSTAAKASALGEWAWTAVAGNDVTVSFDLPGDGSTALAFSNGISAPVDLFANTTGIHSATIQIDASGTTATIGSSVISLTNNSFGFLFKDVATGVYSAIYSWTYYNVPNPYYLLTSANGKMNVSFYTTSPTPSAVPIPGSALLLGSSLLGLVGISTRKKKA